MPLKSGQQPPQFSASGAPQGGMFGTPGRVGMATTPIGGGQLPVSQPQQQMPPQMPPAGQQVMAVRAGAQPANAKLVSALRAKPPLQGL